MTPHPLLNIRIFRRVSIPPSGAGTSACATGRTPGRRQSPLCARQLLPRPARDHVGWLAPGRIRPDSGGSNDETTDHLVMSKGCIAELPRQAAMEGACAIYPGSSPGPGELIQGSRSVARSRSAGRHSIRRERVLRRSALPLGGPPFSPGRAVPPYESASGREAPPDRHPSCGTARTCPPWASPPRAHGA